MEEKIKIIKNIEDLCRKADQTRSINNLIRNKIVLINRALLLYVTIGSAISAMLIFASVPTDRQIYVGIFAASIFIVSLVPDALGFNSKILERTTAVQFWGEWVRDAKNFCNVEVLQMDLDSTALRQKELLAVYKKVMDKTPLISDNEFNKYKRLHLQKIAISRALDKNPFKTIKEIKKNLLQSN